MELAIVLMIVGTLMSGVLVAVSQSTANARITSARAQLRDVEEALFGFAEAYGRLPCPATDDSPVANFEESPCDDMHGFVPSGTLGIEVPVDDNGLLIDPWGNPLRYSILITASAGNPDFSDKSSIQTFFNASTALTSAGMFAVCDDSMCTQTFADTVPAVVMSMGANFATYTSADETLNAGDQVMFGYPVKDDYRFISATYSEDDFDDQILWLSPYVLFNKLVSAGKLP